MLGFNITGHIGNLFGGVLNDVEVSGTLGTGILQGLFGDKTFTAFDRKAFFKITINVRQGNIFALVCIYFFP